MNKRDKTILGGITLCILIFLALRLVFFPWYFLTKCVFEWPIRWDVGVCSGEQ